MKYLLILLLTLSACAHSKKSTTVKELVLISSTEKTSTGGIERVDGKSTSTTYSFMFEKPETVSFEKVWIYQNAYEFESFDHEGAYYVVVQIYAGSRDNVLLEKMPMSTKAKALIQYQDGGETKYLEVDEFNKKDDVVGK